MRARAGREVGDDDFLAARYARITDETKRSEIILFHYENVAGSGRTRAELEPGGRLAPEMDRVLGEHASRAQRRFRVADGPP